MISLLSQSSLCQLKYQNIAWLFNRFSPVPIRVEVVPQFQSWCSTSDPPVYCRYCVSVVYDCQAMPQLAHQYTIQQMGLFYFGSFLHFLVEVNCKRLNGVQEFLPTFSAEPLFPFFFPIWIFKKSLLKSYKQWTKPTDYEVNNNITNFHLNKTVSLTALVRGRHYNHVVCCKQQYSFKWSINTKTMDVKCV